MEYIGFTFAPEYQKNLSQKKLLKYRQALEEAIKLLSITTGLEANLLNGDFKLFSYEE